jgi:UPF0716 protein FxsA
MRSLTVGAIATIATVLVEIAVLIGVTHLLGSVWWTLLLVLLTSSAGIRLLGREGRKAWRGFRDVAQGGPIPGIDVSRRVVGLIAALLLALPGFVTDLAGLVLLLPPVRTRASARLQAYADRRVSAAVAGDLFGPRRVRVRRTVPPHQPSAAEGDPVVDTEPIEGEIIDPR